MSSSVPEPTEEVREAAWQIVDMLEYRSATWVQIEMALARSGPTLRRAARALKLAGVICYDRKANVWSLVGDVEMPASLWPRHALLEARSRERAQIFKALRAIHGEYDKAKKNPESWAGAALARAMQLVCDHIGVPLNQKAWPVEMAEANPSRAPTRAEAEVKELRARLASLRPSGELNTQIECGELFDGSLDIHEQAAGEDVT